MIQSVSRQSFYAIQPIRREDPRREPIEPRSGKPTKNEQLTAAEKKEVQKLRTRDREVRAHEQAHQSTGGQYVTHGATYSYQQGPDGQRYASGGEVGIDSSAESDPQATILKMQVVRAAALAPASPSGQDRQVAAQASRQATKARSELSAQKIEEIEEKKESQKTEETAATETTQPAQQLGQLLGGTIDTRA